MDRLEMTGGSNAEGRGKRKSAAACGQPLEQVEDLAARRRAAESQPFQRDGADTLLLRRKEAVPKGPQREEFDEVAVLAGTKQGDLAFLPFARHEGVGVQEGVRGDRPAVPSFRQPELFAVCLEVRETVCHGDASVSGSPCGTRGKEIETRVCSFPHGRSMRPSGPDQL